MKFLSRGWKQKVCLIFTLAGGLVLFTYYSYHPTLTSVLKGKHFRSADERGIAKLNNNMQLVSDGHKTGFISTTNDSAPLVHIAISETNAGWYNGTEKPDKKVPDIPFDVCKGARFTKARAYPLIALASVPGSGNTWVRYLLERASGFYTGSVYRDKRLYEGGFRGEMGNPMLRKTIIVKIHDTGTSLSTKVYKGGVIIIRNPYDTLLAYANLVHAGHTGWATDEYFNSSKWDKFVESASCAWEDRITTWVNRSNIMVVFFEHLKTDLRPQITRILDFLHVPVDEARLDCMEAHPEGSFHRQKGEKNKTFNPYKEKHKATIEKHIQTASKLLRETEHIDYDLAYAGMSKLI